MKQKLLALALLSMGIGLSGMARADLAGGVAAYKAGRYDEAIKLLTPVAETGDVEAQRRLIRIYEYGQKENPQQATLWMARLAQQGSAEDLSALAMRYQRAEGVPHDRVLAHVFNLLASRRGSDNAQLSKTLEEEAAQMSPEQLAEAQSIAAAWKSIMPLPTTSRTGRLDPRDWYKAAAEAGDLQAAFKAGSLYWKFSYGLTSDPEQAAFWLRKAAQGGIADAQYQLSELYTMGYGVPKDYVLASVLFRLAVKGGSKEAQSKQDGWDDALTEQQLSEGKALLGSWKQGDALPQTTRYGLQRKVNYVEDASGKLAPTPEVEALFKAANEGDEAEFTRLLAKVDNINDYVVGREKLLHALLQPAQSLRDEARDWIGTYKNPRDTAHWHAQQASHAALLPAKTRMLALALQHGARVDEGSYQDHAAPLHLAAMFGTPEMVRMLLKHGADPRQYGGESRNDAPLEFALDQKRYGHELTELITPEQRTGNILALLQAGAARPYILSDIARAKKKKSQDKPERPTADYLLWPEVLSQTRGTAVLDALLKTGTSPAGDGGSKTPYEYAAEAGNAEAIAWLKQRLPRYDEKHRDLWLDAAMLALYSNGDGRDQTLQQLLVKDMDWSQKGPPDGRYEGGYRTLSAGRERVGSDTLMNHAIHARRAEWLPKLIALGAPANTGGNAGDLAYAVEQNDVDGVKFLLSQNADPMEEYQSALEAALKAPGDNDAILDLLLDHILRVQKKTLAPLRSMPLREALTRPAGVNGARVRKLLNAGASVDGLDRVTVDAVFTAPDRDLAGLFMERSTPQDKHEARFLFFAIRAGREELLPQILERGEDPNVRGMLYGDTLQPNAVEYAISRGNAAALTILLAHGGVIDTSTVQPWGTALDRAVASLNPDMLRLVSKDFSLPLAQVCLPSNGLLQKVVLDSSVSYWTLLRKHGFASKCTGIQQRLALLLSESTDAMLEGWPGRQVAERLPQLGPRHETFDAKVWAAIAASKNDALTGLLAKAGWKAPSTRVVTAKVAPQKNKAADQALQAKLPGHYYLAATTEVGAEIILRTNGKFEYSLAYGAVDEYAQGSWKVWNRQVVFRSESEPVKQASMQPAADAPPVTVPQGQLLVDLRYQGKSVPGFKVVVLGDLPLKVEGRTGRQGWRTAFDGPVRQIVVSHPEVNDNRWMVYAVPAADAQRGSYQLDFQPPSAKSTNFNFTLDVHEGDLILRRQDRAMRFEKH